MYLYDEIMISIIYLHQQRCGCTALPGGANVRCFLPLPANNSKAAALLCPLGMAFRPESQRSSLARVSLGGANNRRSLAGRPSLAGAKRPSMAPGDDRRSRGPSMSGR